MTIKEAQQQIAEKLQYDGAWAEKLDTDCDPGIYGIDDWDVSIYPDDIWVNFPKKEFNFKNAEFNFEVRLGGSSDEDSISESHSCTAKGTGKFEYAEGKISEIKDIDIDTNGGLDLIAKPGRITRT